MLPVKQPEQLVLLSWKAPGWPYMIHSLSGDSDHDKSGGSTSTSFSYPIFDAIRAGSQAVLLLLLQSCCCCVFVVMATATTCAARLKHKLAAGLCLFGKPQYQRRAADRDACGQRYLLEIQEKIYPLSSTFQYLPFLSSVAFPSQRATRFNFSGTGKRTHDTLPIPAVIHFGHPDWSSFPRSHCDIMTKCGRTPDRSFASSPKIPHSRLAFDVIWRLLHPVTPFASMRIMWQRSSASPAIKKSTSSC